MNIGKAFRSCLVMVVLLAGCDTEHGELMDMADRIDATALQQQDRENGARVLRFGFDLRASPQEDARQYLPFLNYLQDTTGYVFKLSFVPADSNIVDQLGTNEVQFALIGAVSFIRAQEKYGVVILARGLNLHGDANYRSMIVVAPDSPFTRVEQLRNKRLALGSIDSTQGHLIPRIELARFGLSLKDFSSYAFTGSHSNCANAVVAHKYDACGMQATMAEALEQKKLVRILHKSPEYPSSGIAANSSVSPQVLARVTKALLAFNPNADYMRHFHNWSKTEMPGGFVGALAQDYQPLKQKMNQLGLLAPAGTPPDKQVVQ